MDALAVERVAGLPRKPPEDAVAEWWSASHQKRGFLVSDSLMIHPPPSVSSRHPRSLWAFAHRRIIDGDVELRRTQIFGRTGNY